MIDTLPKSSLLHRPMYENRLLPFINTPLVKIISGIRRCGKSSVLTLLAQNLASQGQTADSILYLNMESLDNQAYTDIQALHQLVKTRQQHCGRPISLFIDEVQEIPQWERAINSILADKLADIYLSGSNSRLLSGELASHLSGRYVELPLYPLSFAEFCQFRQLSTPMDSAAVEAAFNDFLRCGGFPGIHRLEFSQPTIYQYISALCDSVLLKDVIMRHNIRDVALLRSLLIFLADNCGSIFSARSIADYLKKERRSLGVETIYNYLASFEEAFIIYKVPRYDLRGKRLLETLEKYYLADISLRHALLGYREQDIGLFLENIVFLELRKRAYTVHLGKFDDLEIDFVATRGDQRLYVQVCYLLANAETRQREYRPLRLIPDNFPKLVLSLDRSPEGSDQGIERCYLPHWLLAAEEK